MLIVKLVNESFLCCDIEARCSIASVNANRHKFSSTEEIGIQLEQTSPCIFLKSALHGAELLFPSHSIWWYPTLSNNVYRRLSKSIQ